MTRAYFKLCMENVIMKLRCPKKHPFLVKHALGTMFNHFVFKWNGFMIPTWLAHGTEYMQLRMQREFSYFPFFLFLFCRGKYKDHVWANKKYVERIWWCNDSCKMWGWNMITDKCRNDMFIMILWRDAYAMHDMNAFYGHESPENYLFLLAHLGAPCPMCTIKKVIWTFRLPVTKDETNIQCMLEIKCGSDLIRTDFWSKNVG